MQPIAYLNSVFTARLQISWLWNPNIMWLLLGWEFTMMSLAALFPVAMLELCFGMLALPILLFVLAPNNGSTGGETRATPPKPPTSSSDAVDAPSGDASPTNSSSTLPQIMEVGVQMRSLFSCLGLIFAINLLPLFVQVSPGLIEACTVMMFVVLGHILLSKTAWVHAHLQAQKVDTNKCLSEEPEDLPKRQASQSSCEDASEDGADEEIDEPAVEEPLLANDDEEEDEDLPVQEEEAEEDEAPVGKKGKLVWADVEEDEFQQVLAKNQTEYKSFSPESANTQGARAADAAKKEGGKASGKGRKEAGKGAGKGKGEGGGSDKSLAAPIT